MLVEVSIYIWYYIYITIYVCVSTFQLHLYLGLLILSLYKEDYWQIIKMAVLLIKQLLQLVGWLATFQLV